MSDFNPRVSSNMDNTFGRSNEHESTFPDRKPRRLPDFWVPWSKLKKMRKKETPPKPLIACNRKWIVFFPDVTCNLKGIVSFPDIACTQVKGLVSFPGVACNLKGVVSFSGCDEYQSSISRHSIKKFSTSYSEFHR